MYITLLVKAHIYIYTFLVCRLMKIVFLSIITPVFDITIVQLGGRPPGTCPEVRSLRKKKNVKLFNISNEDY